MHQGCLLLAMKTQLLMLLLCFAATSYCDGFSATPKVAAFEKNTVPTLPAGPPYLALITKRNSCDNLDRFQKSCKALKQALETKKVDLVTVRITPSTADPDLTLQLIEFLVQLNQCRVVVHQDWISQAIQTKAHGIHVKEDWEAEIPQIRRQFAQAKLPPPLIGMTAHSLESAQKVACYNPDYLYVGSCFVSSDSHPEKQDVEGITLPGLVVKATNGNCPVFAIGGIEIENCHLPVERGAHGVTAIKSVLQAADPAKSVQLLRSQIQGAYDTVSRP